MTGYLTRFDTHCMKYKIEYLVEDTLGTSWLIHAIEIKDGYKIVHLIGDGNMGQQVPYETLITEKWIVLADMWGKI